MPTALVTGGSAGLGRALAASLARDGWQVFIDGRDADRLAVAARETGAHAIAGDVCDPSHREQLVRAVRPSTTSGSPTSRRRWRWPSHCSRCCARARGPS